MLFLLTVFLLLSVIVILPTVQTPARFMRMVSLSSAMYLSGLEFEGVPASPTSACPITLHTTAPLSHPSLGLMTTDHTVVATVVGPDFTYAVDHTPVVTSVSPRHGSSLGGTRVTLTGQNLPTTIDDVQIEFSGVPCMCLPSPPGSQSSSCMLISTF